MLFFPLHRGSSSLQHDINSSYQNYSAPVFLHLLFSVMHAQTKVGSPVGNYMLQGVMETASGFQLNKDSSFRFFFSYGALDRYGEGKWKIRNNAIVFESKQKPAADFRMIKSSAGEKNMIIVQLKEMNPDLLHYVYCKIKSGGKEQEGKFDKDGRIAFASQPVDSIEVLFEFCPEKQSVIVVASKEHHSFELVPEPWLMEIFFHNFSLQRTKSGLSGGHPLSNKMDFRYSKD